MKCNFVSIHKQILLLFIIFHSSFVKSDIPTHCLKSQVVGKWSFKRTIPVKKSINNFKSKESLCGHDLPSNESTSKSSSSLDFLFNLFQNFEVEFSNDDTILINKTNQRGRWTMVYDEGFNFIINNNDHKTTYFAFLKYDFSKKTSNISSKYASYCYVTLNGWYSDGENWGCFQGHKILKDNNYDIETNGEAENKQFVTEDSRKDKDIVTVTEITQPSNSIFEFRDNHTEVIDEQLNIHKSESLLNSDSNVVLEYPIYSQVSNFLNFKFTQAKYKDKLTLHSEFKEHDKFVERINSANLSWTASTYKMFDGLTINELNNYAGKKKSSSASGNFLLSKAGSSTIIKSEVKNKSFLKSKNIKYSISSSNGTTDMSYLISSIKSQGSCGSCYAASTVTMLESRLKKKYPELKNTNYSISLDFILECSTYNQGCDGGYSYLVLLFGNQFNLVSDRCYSKGSSCSTSCNEYLDDVYKRKVTVNDYYYVGGSYGKCNEEEMIKELDENGPFVVSFEPSYDFMIYKSGIFESKVVKHNWLNNRITRKPEWQKVDHSVVLVGYGEENGKKYWKLLNSWGEDWGERGYFRLVRGIDHLGIESICEAGKVHFE